MDMKRLFIAVLCAACGAQASLVDDMLEEGRTVALYQDKQSGLCVGAIGYAPLTAKATRDLEIARTAAITELSGFIEGRNVSASERSVFSSVDGKVRDAFMSEARTNIKAYLRAVEVVQSGKFGRERYAFARVCKNHIQVSKELKAQLQDNTVQAAGMADLSQGKEKARRMALDDALRNAVAQYHGVTSAAQSTVQDGEDLRSKMATRSSGAVSKYKIVKETIVNGTVRIEIIAEVTEKKVDPKDLNLAVRESLGRPSIYIDTKDSLARTELKKLLVANDYEVTKDKRQARYIMKVDSEVMEEPTLADMLGRRTTLTLTLKDRMSADEAIVIQNDPNDSLEASDNARLRATRSMQYAVKSIEKELLGELQGEMLDQFQNGTKVLVSFKNFGKMREVDRLRELLESLPLTKQVSLRPVDGGTAYYDVLYLGDPNELQMLALKGAVKHRLNGLKAKNRGEEGIEFTF